jgi:HK97 family phage portal protein
VKLPFLNNAVQRLIRNGVVELPALRDDAAWRAWLSGKGYAVTATTALQVAVVIRCADVVAKTMASLPLHLFFTGKGDKKKAGWHPLYDLLGKMPNSETTAYEFWHMWFFNLQLTTGAYAKIVRQPTGAIKEIWNIPTACVVPGRNTVNDERFIDVRLMDGTYERLHEAEFMHCPGLRFGSTTQAEDPIRIASEVLGLTMALNGFAKDFFEQGTNIGGFVEYPGTLSDKAYDRFKESWQASYAGVINQHKVAFLENGSKFQPVSKNPTESQALESRKFQITEICRLMGVPPLKAFDLDRATFSNIEHQNIEFVQESITPMAVRTEQTISKDLISAFERPVYYSRFNVNGLLRGDLAARTLYYNNMRQGGVMNANEIRDLEDMNPIPAALAGDAYLVNGNMISIKTASEQLPRAQQKGAQP